ncbi:MAG: hypothetical protein ACRCVT_15645 [Leadbetterella sp.]
MKIILLLFCFGFCYAQSDSTKTDTTKSNKQANRTPAKEEELPSWEKTITFGTSLSHTLNINAPTGTPKQGLGFNNAIDIFLNYVKEKSRFKTSNEVHWTTTLTKADGKSRTVATADLIQTLHDISFSFLRKRSISINTILRAESPLFSQFDGSYLKDYNQLGLITSFLNPYKFNISPGIKFVPKKGFMLSFSPYSIEYYGLTDQFIADKGQFITEQKPDGHYVTRQTNKLGAEANLWIDKKIKKRLDIKWRVNLSSNYQDKFLKNGRLGGTFITKFLIVKGLALTHRANLKGDLSIIPFKPFYNQVTMLSYTLNL